MTDVPPAEQLLQDIAWLNTLAMTLARDRDEADDLVQEAWIAAWQRQPDATRPMRGWFTKVMRDLARMKRRSDLRRIARDEATDAAQAPAAPDELLAQLRLHQRLVDLVLELDEPYRSTIIARFVEGRTSAAIARSLGIPDGTVRKRLHEALARLRAGLDAGAGDRTRWAPSVIAFAQGGIYVAKPTKLVIGIVVALLLAIATTAVTVVARRGPDDESSSTSSSLATASTTSSARADAPVMHSPDARRAPNAEHRTELLAAIARARDARTHRASGAAALGSASASANPGERSATTLELTDKSGDTSEWGKRALGTLNQVLGECYDLGLAEDANLAGNVTLRFTLVGEPSIGGLLEHVEIVDATTTISQQTIRDCFTQQLYALELDPPPAGVTVEREVTLQIP